jgi:subtilisin family serine protease
MVSSKLRHVLAGTAALAASALPAAAQQADATAQRIETVPRYCSDVDDRAECRPARDRTGRLVVYLPDLLADLFPSGSVGQPAAPATPVAPTAPATAALAPSLASARPAVPSRAIVGQHVPDEVVVTIDGGEADVAQIAAAYGLETRAARVSGLLGASVVRFGIPDGRPVGLVLAQLAGDPRLRERVPNHVYQLQQGAGIVTYAFERIALDSSGVSGEDVGVAIIDTAYDETHPALGGTVVADFDALPDRPVSDRDHGTSVAGIVAGHGPYRGVAPGARLYHARAFENGSSTLDALLTAMEWAIEQDVRIINMSFTGPRNDLFELACRLAGARGIVLVAAAGNAGPGAPFAFPAAYNDVIAVTATNESDGLMEQANRGPYVHVAAPGVDLLAPVAGGTDAVTGTSFAAPVVTGVIANLVREAPGRTPAEIAELLARTAVDLGPPGRDDDFGHGLVNARSAVAGLP